MDAWELLAANTTTSDGWTRLAELSAKGAGKQVYQSELVVAAVQNQFQLSPVADTLNITTESIFTLTDDINAQALTTKQWQP